MFVSDFLLQGTRKALNVGDQSLFKIKRNQSLDPKMSFLVLPGAPSSSQSPTDAKVEGPGMRNFRPSTRSNNIHIQSVTGWRQRAQPIRQYFSIYVEDI